jgi:proline racemase
MQTIETVEYHVGGQVVRVITGGVPNAAGADAAARASWFEAHADQLRRALLAEPRGHDDLLAVALTETLAPGAHAGLLFLDGTAYPPIALAAVAAAATACVERGLLVRHEATDRLADQEVVFETGLGPVRTVARLVPAPGDAARPTGLRVASVSVDVIGAFVHTPSSAVARAGRRVPIDIAFGAGFYAIVDSEAAGVPLDRAQVADLRRVGLELCREVSACFSFRRPGVEGTCALEGVVLTGPPARDTSHLRSAVVSRHGVVDRSSMSGAAAVLAVLAGMGVVVEGHTFSQEGLSGLSVEATLIEGTGVVAEDEPASVGVRLTAEAWMTAEQTWLLHDLDPLRHGSEGP